MKIHKKDIEGRLKKPYHHQKSNSKLNRYGFQSYEEFIEKFGIDER